MQLQDLLFSQGFGTRRVCAGLIQRGMVHLQRPSDLASWIPTEASLELDPKGVQWRIMGVPHLAPDLLWPYQARATLMLHKPLHCECSHKPSAWPSIYTLLPEPLRMRPHKAGTMLGVQAAGRLDQDTTGLLLLTDDGALIHRLSSPKHHVAKVYEVITKHPVEARQVQQLLKGVVLHDAPKPVVAADATQTGEYALSITLTEGKYHQIKRMVAAIGNRVEQLHRARIGGLLLPQDLQPGQWRFLDDAQLLLLQKP